MLAEMSARQDAVSHYRELELRMISKTTEALIKLMQPHFDGCPDNYLVFDLETTGLQPKNALITQFGYCLVKDGKPVDQMGIILNWAAMPQDKFPHDRLKFRLEEVKRHVEFKNGVPTGKKYQVTFDRMVNEGVHPIEALGLIHDLFTEVRKQRRFFVAHNGYHFDVPFIETAFDQFIGDKKLFTDKVYPPFYFDDYELFDTGMVEKGSQSQSIPWGGDTPRSWSIRTHNEILRNVKWALDVSCVPRHGLAKEFNLDMASAHDAGFDCYVCHLLFEKYKLYAKRAAAGEKPRDFEPEPMYRTDRVSHGAPTPTPPPSW